MQNHTNITQHNYTNTNEYTYGTSAKHLFTDSAAMAYIAITVAALSVVIMCCAWVLSKNKTIKKWKRGHRRYNTVQEEEEEIELNPSGNGTFVLGDDDDEQEAPAGNELDSGQKDQDKPLEAV